MEFARWCSVDVFFFVFAAGRQNQREKSALIWLDGQEKSHSLAKRPAGLAREQ
jgi:hypothetical protein